MASSKAKSNAASILAHNLHQSNSPHRSRLCCSSTISSSSPVNTSSMASLFSQNRISIRREHVSSSPVRFSIDQRIASPGRSVTSSSPKEKNNQSDNQSNGQKKTCMCSPTTHPGSFRCSLHKSTSKTNDNGGKSTSLYQAQRLYGRRPEMTNSVVRISGSVEGELVKSALTSLIRPASHRQRPPGDFQPRPSRLSVMSKAED